MKKRRPGVEDSPAALLLSWWKLGKKLLQSFQAMLFELLFDGALADPTAALWTPPLAGTIDGHGAAGRMFELQRITHLKRWTEFRAARRPGQNKNAGQFARPARR